MSRLDELLEVDNENVLNSKTALDVFNPPLLDMLERAAEMFFTFSRCIEGTQDESAEFQVLEQYAKTHELSAKEGIELIGKSEGGSSVPPQVWQAYLRMWARRARAVIFLLLERSYNWGATDLLRMRMTPAAGYCRLEAEALGLMLLMQDDPKIGHRWLKVANVNVEEGRAFFKETQPKLKERLKSIGLAFAYDRGSAAALHVRLASAVGGLSWSDTHARLNYQEVRRDDPFSYFTEVLGFLNAQVHIFHALTYAFPEVTDPIWHERARIFSVDVGRLWEQLEKRFPEESKAMAERSENDNTPNTSPFSS